MQVEQIDSLTHPALEPYRRLKLSNLTRWSGWFIAEGQKVVQRLLDSAYRVESVLLSSEHVERIAEFATRVERLLVIPPEMACELIGFQFHAGVLACGIRGSAPHLAQLPADWPARSLVVACDRITDPDNLGTIMRLSAAFGVDALLLGPGCCDPFSRRALRVSMGNAFSLSIIEASSLEDTIETLRPQGFRLLPAILHPEARPLHTVVRPPRAILLLGNEADGLAPHWMDRADLPVVIPMSGDVDSLNVAMAAAILLYHFSHYGETP